MHRSFGSRVGWFVCLTGAVGALLFAPLAVAEEPEVLVELERQRIFEGESARYTVLLNHCENSARPVLPQIPGVDVQHVGVTVLRQSTFDGFKRISIGGPRHEYVVTPHRVGPITIPGPTVEVQGKTYRGESLTLYVSPPNEQDLAMLEFTASRPWVYPMQPLTLRLTVALKGLPEPHFDKDPLRGVGEVPVLTIPWAEDEKLPDGVEPESPALRWVQPLLAEGRRPIGFGINDLRTRGGINFGFGGRGLPGFGNDPFSMFTDAERALFHPPPRRAPRQDAQGRTVEYWEYTFERTFTAKQVGPLEFGPVKLKGSFAAKVDTGGHVEVADVYAVTKPVVVEVRGAPAEGRPDSYIRAIGKFQVAAELSPTSAKVGDPMTLSLRVFGRGALQDATPPRLEQNPAVVEAFKVYDATEQSSPGERTFQYTLRPKEPGTRSFPPVEIAYFDYDREQYVTIRTDPIPLEIAQADHLAPRDIAVAAPGPPPATGGIETNAEGIFANITDPRRVTDQRVNPALWLLALGSMAMAYGVCCVTQWARQRRLGDPHYLRRKGALHRAQMAVTDAGRQYATGHRRQAIEQLSGALTGLVADVVGSPAPAFTAREVADQLASLKIREPVIRRCQEFLEQLDAARYGDETVSWETQIGRGERLIGELAQELRQRKMAI